MVQFSKINMVALVNKPYVNGVAMRDEILFLKSGQTFESEVCLQHLGSFQEILWFFVGPRDAKLQIGGLKKIFNKQILPNNKAGMILKAGFSFLK